MPEMCHLIFLWLYHALKANPIDTWSSVSRLLLAAMADATLLCSLMKRVWTVAKAGFSVALPSPAVNLTAPPLRESLGKRWPRVNVIKLLRMFLLS
jgi:hypothetical protein